MLEEASYPDIHCYHSLVQLLVLRQMWRVQIASATTAKLINHNYLLIFLNTVIWIVNITD